MLTECHSVDDLIFVCQNMSRNSCWVLYQDSSFSPLYIVTIFLMTGLLHLLIAHISALFKHFQGSFSSFFSIVQLW